MPLMHSENIEDQRACLSELLLLEAKATKEGNADIAKHFAGSVSFSKSHMEVIEKFGRYPTRNKVLQRKNTQEEEEYLKTANAWG